ncbi:hypothetical protein TSAR_013380 [Trichomalopsis sarcophagae]|uniref:WAP domain-containing protein n=1 Tax=Trichomalopsis sarcophagae TaxID=543379 RepID=A0A232EKC3_9HYME|nr:hypothetical protein TSAR_013380 [Trichomalopsis sarcophagae]
MHSAPAPALITFPILLIVVLSLITTADTTPTWTCRYWCKEDRPKYFCCPSGKTIKKNMFHWVMGELFDLHDDPWTSISNNWIYYLWPIVFPRSSSSHDWNTPPPTSELEGRCPDLRPQCPRDSDPPTLCNEDDECGEGFKCCFDVCLDRKTCQISII